MGRRLSAEDIERYEKLFNDLVHRIGLDVTVVYSPDPDAEDRGRYIPKEKLIILYDEDPDEAFETLKHEVAEIRLYPLIKKYKLLVNTLIEYIDKKLEHEKELAIEKLVKDITRLTHEYDKDRRLLKAKSRLDKFFEDLNTA